MFHEVLGRTISIFVVRAQNVITLLQFKNPWRNQGSCGLESQGEKYQKFERSGKPWKFRER